MKKEELTSILKRHGLFVTNSRLQVLSVLTEHEGPLSIENITQRASRELAMSTLYRVVADLLDAKLVRTFSSPDHKLMVELSDEPNEHHHHLYCESCQRVLDIDLDPELEKMISGVITKIEETHSIEITEHSFEIYGRCSDPGMHNVN